MGSLLTRRRLLTNGVGLIALAGVGFGGRVFNTNVEDVLVHIVEAYVGKSNLAEGAAQSFARDYAPLTTASTRFRTTIATNLYTQPAFRTMIPNDHRERLEFYDRKVITDFILSSNFELDTTDSIDYFGLNLEGFCNPYARVTS